jgi:YYY domain-containing protein
MDYSRESTTPIAAARSFDRRGLLITTLLFLAVVVIGAYFRTINLRDWDGQTGQHPDERFMHYTVFGLEVPDDWRTYLASTCPSPMPQPRNPQDKLEDWAPSATSGCSTLNPRNFAWSRGYVYGTLPTTLTRVVAEVTQRTGVDEILMIGRGLSALADLITLITTFFLGRALYGRRVGLLAAALYAGAVMPIQQSHFFTVDNFAVCFGTLALLFAVRLGQRGQWRDAILTGLWIGAAVASKINMAALVALVFVALAQRAWVMLRAPVSESDADADMPMIVKRLARLCALLCVTGIVTFLAFRVFQPDAFTGPNLWNIGLEPRFSDRLREARLTANGTIDLPSSHQWAGRAPWLFPWQNMVLWGMGAPLGVIAWIAWAAAGWQMLTRWRFVHVVPWLWIALYFGWQGQQFVTTLRYFLPLYSPLIVFAAWSLIRLYDWAMPRRARVYPTRAGLFYRWLPRFQRRALAIGLVACVLGATWAWAWAYTRIYTRPYTRVMAAQWIKQAAPNGAITTWEWWDDLLPFSGHDLYQQKTTYPYAEDELAKYVGRYEGVSGAPDDAIGLIEQLSRADYIVLTSPRVYGSVVRVPQRFPATLRYYQALFDGSLGFQLAADFHSFPSLFGLPISDLGAEEAFWVYDHPRVLIFRRTPEFSPERARRLITEDINWDEVYRGLRPAQVNTAPTALQLTEHAWNKLQAMDTRYLFTGPLGTVTGLVVWLLAFEVLGLATCGMLWRLRLPLADRGLNLARFVGLLLFAGLPALLGALQLVGISRWLLLGWYGVLVLIGLWRLFVDRHEIRAFLRPQGSAFWLPQALYGATVVGGAVLLTWLPAASSEILGRWTALVRTATLPPYDPFFAGGHDPLPYTARLPFALLDKLLGLDPATALRYVIPTALALLLLGVWSALYNSFAPRNGSTEPRTGRRRSQASLLALLGALLVVVPGVLLSGMMQVSIWHAIVARDGEVLGLAALVAATIALGMSLLRARFMDRLTLRGTIALLLLPLVLLRGHGSWVFLACFTVVAALAWAGMRGNIRRWAGVCVTLLVGAVVLGQMFAWSLAAPPMQPAPFEITSTVLLLGLSLPLAVLAVLSMRVGPQITDRGTLMTVAVFVATWTLLVCGLGWSGALLAAPFLMAFSWLAILSWLPGWGPRRWRLGAVLATAAIAAALLIIAALMLAGRVAGDAVHLFVVATILLICAAGWSLPQLAQRRFWPSLERGPAPQTLATAIGVVLVAGTLTGGFVTAQARDASSQPDTVAAPELMAAAQWLARETTGAPILVVAPTSAATSAVSATGLPTLLTAIDTERRLRDALQPSIGGVLDGRQRAINDLYGGGVEQARQLLQTYRVGYVLVGPEERAVFGESAGTALDVLAQNNAIELAYDRDGVSIYRVPPKAEPPQFVAQRVRLQPPATKTLMLDQPVDQLPIVNEYGWNGLASNVQPLGVVLWLLLLEVLGLLALPLTVLIFRRWHDYGWSLSKLVGLIVWGYAVWLPVNLRWWIFNWWSLVIGAVLLALLSGLAFVRQRGGFGRLRTSADRLRIFPDRSVWFRSELCFLIAFSVWTLIRAANPDLWHPYFGGEKPFEFGFLNAILRSPVLPPYDPFFSDGIVNYYYYGLFLVALPIKATGIDPAIGFNLAIATLFALTATAAFGLGRQLTGRWRYGLVAILLLVGVGPFASVFVVTESKGVEPILEALRDGLAGFGGRVGAWFWGPSRVIPNTINEFPLFGFLFADLHPHLIALPITLLAIACAVELAQRRPPHARQGSGPLLGLSALVIGALAIANSWDAPTYALLIGGALVGRSWRSGGHGFNRYRLVQTAQGALVAVGVTAIGLALYTPFFLHYQAMVGGIGRVQNGDRIVDYVLLYGPMLFVGLTLLSSLTWLVAYRFTTTWRIAARGAVITLPLLIGVMLLSGWALPDQPVIAAGWPLRIFLALLAGTGIGLALVARLRDKEWMPLWLITVGLLVALGIQFIFVQDHLAGGTSQRMNTVFKFGQQIWTLWAVGAVAALPLIVRLLRRYELMLGVWLGILIALLVPGLLYPLVGIPSRLSTRFNTDDGLTLDGLAFMERARYIADKEEIDLRFDGQAITWIKQHIAGTPVFATSEAEFYRTYGMRIAANTGVPTVLGRLHQDEQRPGALVQERDRDVHTLFTTTDIPSTLQILAKYHVDYVYVGPIERLLYGAEGAAKWEQMQGTALDLVFRNEGVQIYRVKPEALTNVVVETPPDPAQPSFDDPALRALEAQVADNPGDSSAAFGLGQRYVQLNRPDDAARVLSNAAQNNPNDVPLHHLLGDVQAQLGRADEAIAAWQHAASVQQTPQNLNKLGQGLIQFGRWQEAERVLNEALTLDAAFPDPHFYLGELYRSRNENGDRERAVEAYQHYLAAAPGDGPWRRSAEERLKELGQ